MSEQKLLSKTYEPKEVEERIYKNWMDNGYFKAEVDPNKKPFSIVMPPPNITGQLHMGHALDETLQDILTRWKRMQGYATLWLPGTDHASIATEAKVVEKLREEGTTKEELGREKFLEKVWEWKEKYGGRIAEQLKKLGSSCDWSRERFTMDEGLSDAVLEVFVRLYEKGLIYKGERITNWCPKCYTSISDIEVEYEEQKGNFWHIAYKSADGKHQVIVATTRPETMLGDTAIAVHPEDEKYKDLVGKTVILPLLNKEIPVIADSYVDREFGTGAVKVTPAHDPNDFEIGMRHSLPVIRIMDDHGNINENGGKYTGMDRYAARKAIIEDLKTIGQLVKVEDHTHNVGQCYRCHTTIEPIISTQWYVKMGQLAQPAIDVIKSEQVKFVPERFSKIYFNWMENIQDWCISRQIWWGHRIPAYYCEECNEMVVAKSQPEKCPKCGNTHLKQDEDTLDTWFSSALWPFSTLGWPNNTKELEYFYPTSVLVTGYDIIFFWVARMIFSGMEQTGKEPFKHVFVHGLVRDSLGRKMSKSLGNGVDPLEVMEKYGTDALRISLVMGNATGSDIRYSDDKVEANRNFANKIWNASRFVLMNLDCGENLNNYDKNKLTLEDKWILSRVNNLAKEVTENLEKFELGVAVQKVYEFFWEEFCDWYIEMVKPRLYDINHPTRLEAQYTLNKVLMNALKLLHPFMPFVTEEIYTHLIHNDKSIMTSIWPEFNAELDFSAEEQKVEVLMDVIKNVRNIRANMNVPPSKKAKLILVSTEHNKTLELGSSLIERLASASEVEILSVKSEDTRNTVTAVIPGIEIFIPMNELIDIEKEIERLEGERKSLEKEIKRVDDMFANESFMSKAPARKIEEEKAKKENYQDMMDKVVARLDELR